MKCLEKIKRVKLVLTLIVFVTIIQIVPLRVGITHEDKCWRHLDEEIFWDGKRSCGHGIELWKAADTNEWWGIFIAHNRVHISRFYIDTPNCDLFFERAEEVCGE